MDIPPLSVKSYLEKFFTDMGFMKTWLNIKEIKKVGDNHYVVNFDIFWRDSEEFLNGDSTNIEEDDLWVKINVEPADGKMRIIETYIGEGYQRIIKI
jgi:hypothetical protein